MSQISLMPPFEGIRGKFGKNVIIRQKKYRAPNGKVLFKGAKESYPLENPRDYTKSIKHRKIYKTLRTFIQAILCERLKNNQ